MNPTIDDIKNMDAHLERARMLRQMNNTRPHAPTRKVYPVLRRSFAEYIPRIQVMHDPLQLSQITRSIHNMIKNNNISNIMLYLSEWEEKEMIDNLRNNKIYKLRSHYGHNGNTTYAYRNTSYIYHANIDSKCNVTFVAPYVSQNHSVKDDGTIYANQMEYYYKEEIPEIIEALDTHIIRDLIGVVLECINYEPNVNVDMILENNWDKYHINKFNG